MTAKVSRAHVAGGGCSSHVDWNCQVGSWAVGLVGKDGLIKAGNVVKSSPCHGLCSGQKLSCKLVLLACLHCYIINTLT